jgi:uncharacterized protein YijF (DUF1287 family)
MHCFYRTILLLILSCGVSLSQEAFPSKLITAARSQVGVTTTYDPAYVALKYPMGDLPRERGVCTDVVIRALRECGHDLQELVHLDMKKNFAAYPKNWGLKSTDKNIDHRRVPNLMTYFTRRGMKQPAGDDPKRFQPGDLVTCLVAKTLPHIMIVSDKRGPSGHYLVLHNIGAGACEEDCLHDYPHTGHFRWK